MKEISVLLQKEDEPCIKEVSVALYGVDECGKKTEDAQRTVRFVCCYCALSSHEHVYATLDEAQDEFQKRIGALVQRGYSTLGARGQCKTIWKRLHNIVEQFNKKAKDERMRVDLELHGLIAHQEGENAWTNLAECTIERISERDCDGNATGSTHCVAMFDFYHDGPDVSAIHSAFLEDVNNLGLRLVSDYTPTPDDPNGFRIEI